MGPQRLTFYYNSEMFDLTVKLNGKNYDIECITTTYCRTELKEIPSMNGHNLEIEINQIEGLQALKEEDFRIVYEEKLMNGQKVDREVNLLLIDGPQVV